MNLEVGWASLVPALFSMGDFDSMSKYLGKLREAHDRYFQASLRHLSSGAHKRLTSLPVHTTYTTDAFHDRHLQEPRLSSGAHYIHYRCVS